MAKRALPRRPEAHQLEEASERFLRTALPKSWVCERVGHDYGVDLRIDVFDRDQATGLELLVQLKATARPSAGDSESLRLRTTTYNYLRAKLQVVMLVRFVATEKEAYWLLLRDVGAPRRAQRTFVVHIPRTNRLSQISWDEIANHLRTVTDAKLAVTRRRAIERQRQR